MSLTTDQDLELLEAFVDGELTAQEETALHARLAGEPQLAALLESVRAERGLRAEVWKSFEPDPAAIDRLIERVHGSVDRNTRWAARLSKLRLTSTAAACILVGFLVGRAAYKETGPDGLPSGPMTVVQVPQGGTSVPGGVTNVRAPVQFRIVDSNNQPVTLQPFRTEHEAQEFMRAWQQWLQQQQQMRGGGGTAPQVESF